MNEEWKPLSDWRQEMHQLYPIITLCGLTEACVLIMSGWALFLPCFVYICAWCQLRSVVPSPNSMAESTAVGTEQRSYQLQFMLPSVTLPRMSMRFRSAASRVPATFCNPLHFLALCWPYKYGLNLGEGWKHTSILLLLFCTSAEMHFSFFFFLITLQIFTILILLIWM